MKTLFVYNKRAGKKFLPSIVDQIKQAMPNDASFECIDLQDFKQFDFRTFDVLVAVGGDGTVNFVASKAHQTQKVLGIIPRGSGDGLARFLAIPRGISEAVNVIQSHKTIEIDTASVGKHFFLNVAGAGFEAKVAHRFGQGGIRGILGYATTIASMFSRSKEKEAQLLINGKKLSIRFFSLSIANGAQWGNDFQVARHADIQDGLLDVAIIRKPKLYELPSLIAYLKQKKKSNNKLITYYKAAEIELKKSGKRWHIDGEPIKIGKKKTVQINTLPLKVIVP